MKKWFGPVVAVILLGTILAMACSSPSTSSPSSPPAASSPTTSIPTVSPTSTTSSPTTTPQASPTTIQPRYGGVFIQLETSGPINIGDPAIVPGIPTFYRPAGESLFYLDKEGNPVPRLATSWEFDPDGKYVTFHLRKGVKFQDGSDFNAQAVKFCLDRGIQGQAPGLKPVTSVDVVDDYTVRVNWPGFDYSVWDTLGGQKSPSWIVSPTSIETHDKDWPKLNIVGTGAFKFVDYQRDVSMDFERFDDYWQEGLPYLDRVQFKLVVDQTTALFAFKAGAGEMLRNLTPANANDLKKSGGYDIVETPGASVFMAFSSKNPDSPFNDLKVRQAVIQAVDSAAVAEGIGRGYYLPANQTFPPWSWGSNPDIKGYPYDPVKAKLLLGQAGYGNGFKTSIYTEAGPSLDMPVAIQAYLKVIGINAEIKTLSAPAIADLRTNSGWDGLISGQLLTLIGGDPGSGMQGMGFVNRGTYYTSVQRTDDTLGLLNQANSEVDRAKRESLLQEMSRLITDKYAMILPIYYTQTLVAVQPYVHDIGLDEFGYTYELAWLSK